MSYNSFRTNLNSVPFGKTENGANMYETTGNRCLDFFALGTSMRNRSDEDCIDLFKKAYNEDATKALQILWYFGDVRGGQGERRLFRVCYKWLFKNHPNTALKYFDLIPEYKRWDDLIYIAYETDFWNQAMRIVGAQLREDIKNAFESKPISLLAKWLMSENASNPTTRKLGRKIAKSLNLTYREYRKTLSALREYLNIVESNLTQRTYDKIEYDKVPSKANIKYGSAFARNDYDRYNAFINDNKKKINMSVTYPYEIISKVNDKIYYGNKGLDDSVVNKMWANLPDYLDGDKSNTICVVDTSGSMYGTPLDVACSLGLYFGERNRGPFKDCFISFSSKPKLIEFADGTFADKVRDIYRQNLCENTDIKKVFDLLLNIAQKPTTKKEDIPKNILIISDMEFDHAQEGDFESAFDKIKRDWEEAGFEMPHLIFHNVDARQNNVPIIDKNQKVSLVSGMSPIIYKTLITGKTGVELMNEILIRYEDFIAID